jgi:hypothetical protein
VPAVDLNVGGVQIDRHLRAQRRGPLRGQHGERRRGDVPEPGLHRRPLRRTEPAGQPGRGRRGQAGHRGQLLPGSVGALAVQPDPEVLPGQLRGRDPDQQLPAGEPAAALLERPDRRVQPADHVQPVGQLGHRQHPDTGVNVRSGAPIRTRRRPRRQPRTLPTR